MAKKDFTQINTEARSATRGAVGKNVLQGTGMKGHQPQLQEEELRTRLDEMRTQGRKGCKAARINMAFTPANYDFLVNMATAHRSTMTKMCNAIIAQYQLDHPDMKEKAEEIAAAINKNAEENPLPTF